MAYIAQACPWLKKNEGNQGRFDHLILSKYSSKFLGSLKQFQFLKHLCTLLLDFQLLLLKLDYGLIHIFHDKFEALLDNFSMLPQYLPWNY